MKAFRLRRTFHLNHHIFSYSRRMSLTDNNVWGGLLPKEETAAAKFLAANPTFDGRGIVVGILDTGVDPGATGLELTTDGKRKVIDVIDCSGSGDVTMGPPVEAKDGYLTTARGTQLKLNPNWKNPTGEYRLGMKRAVELYPGGLGSRVSEHRKKAWDKDQQLLEARLLKDILAAEEGGKPALEVDELKAQLSQLRSMADDLEDPGALFDCVVFHDGTYWQAVIDTAESADMSSKEPMTDYRVAYQYDKFSNIDELNYCVNIFDEGSTLSIVVDTGAHGTHVAGITSAYHPDAPECNGVAPGAQIVSLKIGDTRLGSMETGVGLMRGLIEAVKRGCHIINMSYGEATAWDNYGPFVQLANQLVHKHGVMFISSAGNNGPCISTVGCPGGTSSCCISVGAYVTQSLMTAAYSMHTLTEETNYTWSSVGPTLDGDIGVDIIAPGGAVTSVPHWTMNKKQLMNGTSMSSPNATGCIALILSAAKQSNIETTPAFVRRAIENSAKYVPQINVLGQGSGLVQVDKAWTLLEKLNADIWKDVWYKVSVNSERFARGIYLRQPHEASTASSFEVTVTPQFHEDTLPATKVKYEVRVKLAPTVSWVKCAEHCVLMQAGKSVAVMVDPRALPPGLHTAFVEGFVDSPEGTDMGPLFKIPVTVVRPEIFPEGTTTLDIGAVTFSEAERYRRFIVPPSGCQFVDLVVNDTRTPSRAVADGSSTGENKVDDNSRLLALHALQLFRGTPYRDNEEDKYMRLSPGSTHVASWAVHPGVTMELTLARYWSTIGDTSCTATLYFRGVVPSMSPLTITGGQKVSPMLRVSAPLASETIAPSAKLDKWTTTVFPTTAGKVSPLGERDFLPDGRPIYQLALEYEFDQVDAGEVCPRFPGLQGVLYESDFLAQFFMVFDSKKKLLFVGDAWPKGKKIGKGKHTVRLQAKHLSPTVLEGLTEMPMQLERTLKSAMNLSFFKTQSDALIGGSKMGTRAIALGGSVSMYVKEPAADQLPKTCSPGDTLTGTVTYIKKQNNQVGCGTKPGGYPLIYTVSAKSKEKSGNGKENTKSLAPAPAPTPAAETETKGAEELPELAEALKEAKLKYLKGLIGKETFGTAYKLFKAEYAEDLQIRLAGVSNARKVCGKAVTDASSGTATAESVKAAVEAAKSVLDATCEANSLIDSTAVAAALGVNADKDDAAEAAKRKDAETKKAAIIECYSADSATLLELLALIEKSDIGEAFSDSYRTVLASSGCDDVVAAASDIKNRLDISIKGVEKWDNLSADKHWKLCVGKHKAHGRYGLALKRLNELIAAAMDNKGKDLFTREALFEERDQCLEKLHMSHILERTKILTALASKIEYDPF